jgi:hypothetical protein
VRRGVSMPPNVITRDHGDRQAIDAAECHHP